MFDFFRKKSRVPGAGVKHAPKHSIFAKQTVYHQPDYFLALIVFALIIFGLIMVSSASVVISNDLVGNNYHFLKSQLTALMVGLFVWIIVQAIPYQFWRRFAFPALLLAIGLLIIPAFPEYFPGIAFQSGGAHRWIHFGPLFLQPSEIAKLALVIYLAAWLEKKGASVRDFASGFVPFVIVLGVMIILIMKQPDMGSMFVMGAAATGIFFVAGASWFHLMLGGVAAGGVLWILIKSASYRLARFLVFLNPESDPKGIGYHVNQALIAIGSGGWWGLGFGKSRQKFHYLPEVSTDSIYAVIVEELGFLRAALIPVLFILFCWRGLRIARLAPDPFGRLLATGITAWITLQALINISAMVGLLPLTGIPLPFISYGGSSLVVCLIGVGILMNVSRQTVLPPERTSITAQRGRKIWRFFRRKS
jgi:cell division protein FtsW